MHSRFVTSVSPEERRVVVLEMGTSLCKVGFSGDDHPRHICRSEIKDRITGKMVSLSQLLGEKSIVEKDLERFLCDMIHYLYYRVLLMNPKERRLCIVESPFQPTVMRNVMVKVFFRHFGINLLSFIPSPCACCLAVIKPTALVVDVGWDKAVITPVIEGNLMVFESEVVLVGAKTIQQQVRESLIKNSMLLLSDNSLIKVAEKPSVLTSDIIEHITVRTCFVSPQHRAEKFADLENNTDFKHAPALEFPLEANEILQVTGLTREFSAECCFSFNGEEANLGLSLANAVYNCPIDVRKELLANILLVGGTCHLPGFKHRLMTEIDHILKNGPLADKFVNNQAIAFHNQPCKPVSTSWLGASFAASSESPNLKFISLKEFNLKPNIVADWNIPKKIEA